ncbi:uncharacterized protein PHACADRAFT_51048, partial [Phanerochaete carnosa HHB-10118-sp]
LFCYDCLLTVSEEIAHIWRRKFSLTTYLYLINRYIMFANRLARFAGMASRLHQAPSHADDNLDTMATSPQSLIHPRPAAFSALRIYGISNRSCISAALVLAIGLVGPGVNFV